MKKKLCYLSNFSIVEFNPSKRKKNCNRKFPWNHKIHLLFANRIVVSAMSDAILFLAIGNIISSNCICLRHSPPISSIVLDIWCEFSYISHPNLWLQIHFSWKIEKILGFSIRYFLGNFPRIEERIHQLCGDFFCLISFRLLVHTLLILHISVNHTERNSGKTKTRTTSTHTNAK